MRGRLARQPNWLPAVLYALALHAVVIALLVVSFRIVSRDEAPSEAIQATVVREPAPEAKPEPEPPKPDPELAKREAERKQREAEAQRLEQQRAQQELERQKQEQEKRKQEEVKLRLDAEKEKKQEEEKKKKEEAQRRKQEEAEQRKRDEERKQAEKQRQQQTEQTLREQLEAEEKARTAARAAVRTARAAREADKYKAAIRQRVERHWVRPSSSRKGLQCTVRVRLIPGGEVLEATVVRSSGDATFDRSVESAVHKASPLPLPEDAELFEQFREIEFIFRPEE